VESLALYNGERTLLLNVQKSQDENTIGVVDGLNKTLAELQTQLPARCQTDSNHRWLAPDQGVGGQCAPHPDRRARC
jgi:hypothetical protein